MRRLVPAISRPPGTATRTRAISSCWSAPICICGRSPAAVAWTPRARSSPRRTLWSVWRRIASWGDWAAGIEVLRAQMQVETRRAQLIDAENALEKTKLQLARPLACRSINRSASPTPCPYAPLAAMGVDEALAQAYQARSDYKQKQALVSAAERR